MEEEKRFRACVEALKQGESLSREDWRVLLEGRTDERQEILAGEASLIRDRVYGKRVFVSYGADSHRNAHRGGAPSALALGDARDFGCQEQRKSRHADAG